MTLWDFAGSGSVSIRISTVGATCQESPYHEAEQEAAVRAVVDLADVEHEHAVEWSVDRGSRQVQPCDAVTSPPPLPVEPAILNRLGDVSGRDALLALQVGDRARDAQHAVV